MSFKRVVITGMGALTPVGNDIPTFWKNLVAGVSGAAPITRFDAEKFRTRFACEVKGLDINDYIPRPALTRKNLTLTKPVLFGDLGLVV